VRCGRFAGLCLVAVLGLGAGCGVGDGSGIAGGTLFVEGCRPRLGINDFPLYDLKPTFFAGQPIEDICPPPGDCPGERTNRLIIRMQRTGKRIEVDDTIYIDVENSVAVARCIRGSTKAGVKAWDHRTILNPDGSPTNIPFCDWNWRPAVDGGAPGDGGAPDGGVADGGVGVEPMTAPRARINLSTLDYVRGSIMPLESCHEQRLVGVSLPGSYIEFEDFGTAAQPDIPPDQRGEIGGDFKVLFGERLRATFHLVLGDQRVTDAMHKRNFIPNPMIGGVIDGQFDFDLDRTRAAQPFP
jgi:hypothetical protein